MSMNSHVGLTLPEYQTLKFRDIPRIIRERVYTKWARVLGRTNAESVLGKYEDRPFREVADCSVIDIWDCFFIYA